VPLSEIIPLANKIIRRKNTQNALVTLGVVSTNSSQYYLLGKQSLSDVAIDNIDLTQVSKLWNAELKSVLAQWKSVSEKNQNIVLADVGWNDTIYILLREILQEKNVENEISALYLGRTGTNIFSSKISTSSQGIIFNSLSEKQGKYFYQPELWECFLNRDNRGLQTRKDILEGIRQAIEFYMQSELTPLQYWQQTQPQLLEIFRRPSREIIEVLSTLQFDYGTKDEPVVSLVDSSFSTIQVWRMLFLHRGEFKSFYFHQGWKWGAASYYHFRIPYRVYRRIIKKPSF